MLRQSCTYKQIARTIVHNRIMLGDRLDTAMSDETKAIKTRVAREELERIRIQIEGLQAMQRLAEDRLRHLERQ